MIIWRKKISPNIYVHWLVSFAFNWKIPDVQKQMDGFTQWRHMHLFFWLISNAHYIVDIVDTFLSWHFGLWNSIHFIIPIKLNKFSPNFDQTPIKSIRLERILSMLPYCSHFLHSHRTWIAFHSLFKISITKEFPSNKLYIHRLSWPWLELTTQSIVI